MLVLRSKENLAKIREFCTFGYDKKYSELVEECADQEHRRNAYHFCWC